MKTILIGIVVALATATVLAASGGSANAGQDKITICHAAGQSGTLKYVTLVLPPKAVYGKNGRSGHFNEQGAPSAGHENDYLGPCLPPSTTTTVKPTTTTTVKPTTTTTVKPTTTTSTTTTVKPTTTTSTTTSTTTTVEPTTTTTTTLPPDDTTTTTLPPDDTTTTTLPPDDTTTTSIVIDTCEQFGSCESTTTTTDPGGQDNLTTTTGVVTASTHPPTGAGSTMVMSGFASIMVGLGAVAMRLARRVA